MTFESIMNRVPPLALGLALLTASAEAAMPPADCRAIAGGAFTSYPVLIPAGRGDRQGVSYCLSNLRADEVARWSGSGGFDQPSRVSVAENGFKVTAGSVGNYHWLQASQMADAGIVTASTAHYFSNPGPAPTAMLHLPKSDLEIVPQPLPREHGRYRAGETWKFLVRFQGQPLKSADVHMETSGGTRQTFKTDTQGIVRVVFPDDLPHESHAGGHDHGRRTQNRFVLATSLNDTDGRRHLTAFNHVYGFAAGHGRSLFAGLGFLGLGGLLATPLVIRRKDHKSA